MSDLTALQFLRSTTAVRERCSNILAAALAGSDPFFTVNLAALGGAAQRVNQLIDKRFGNKPIPYHARWRHFEAGGIDRLQALPECSDNAERARREIDLAVTAVLLDAGSGAQWKFTEATTGWSGGRSEGLGVAAFHAFASGLFGGSAGSPRAQADALQRLKIADISDAFQVSAHNPLVGLEGRTALLTRLANALTARPDLFGTAARPGHMFDYLTDSGRNKVVSAASILSVVLEGLGPIWLTESKLGGVSLGDVWQHKNAGGERVESGQGGAQGEGTGLNPESAGWVPFHKLSQWMTYSLLEPFERAGITVTGLDQLTGLPEYRNGGLLIDEGVLQVKSPAMLELTYEVGDAFIISWRALTVALLDHLAVEVRALRGLTAEQLPLACVLEGGSWAAGRQTAQELRGGLPPVQVNSDGTVF